MTPREVLIAARAKVAQGWTRYVAARDATGAQVISFGAAACCWCLLGAVSSLSAGSSASRAAIGALADAAGLEEASELDRWNDAPGRTQAEVVALFDRAIAEAA